MDAQRIQALTNLHGTASAFCFHFTNAVIEELRVGRAKSSEVLKTSAKSVRQSGWRLKFPENLATAPVIGRSHWSQIIRMLFTSTRRARLKRVPFDSLLSLPMPQRRGSEVRKKGKKPNESAGEAHGVS
jgi:hypothetical protein